MDGGREGLLTVDSVRLIKRGRIVDQRYRGQGCGFLVEFVGMRTLLDVDYFDGFYSWYLEILFGQEDWCSVVEVVVDLFYPLLGMRLDSWLATGLAALLLQLVLIL